MWLIDWFLFHVFAFLFFELYIFSVSCGFVFSYLFSLELKAQFDVIAVVLLSIFVCKVWWWMLFFSLFICVGTFGQSFYFQFHWNNVSISNLYMIHFFKRMNKKLRLIMCVYLYLWMSKCHNPLFIIVLQFLVYFWLSLFACFYCCLAGFQCVYFINFQLYLFPLVLHLWSLWFLCLYSVLSRHSVCVFLSLNKTESSSDRKCLLNQIHSVQQLSVWS